MTKYCNAIPATLILSLFSSLVHGQDYNERTGKLLKAANVFQCFSDGFHVDPNDCAVFYRCTDWGESSENSIQSRFIPIKFRCAEGTVFDLERSNCVNIEETSRLECRQLADDEDLYGRISERQAGDPDYGVVQPSPGNNNQYQQPSYNTPGPKEPSEQIPGDSGDGDSNSNGATSPSTSPPCEADGFFPIPNDCTHFYRCVSSGNGFLKYDFSCGPGTVWDPDNNACNHPWATSRPDCRSGTDGSQGGSETIEISESPETAAQVVEPSSTTTAATTTNRPTYRPSQSTTSASYSRPTTTKSSTTTTKRSTTTAPSSTTTTESPETSPVTEGSKDNSTSAENSCSSEGFFPDEKNCTKFYRCVDQGNGKFTKYEFECAEGTVWDVQETTCNYPYAVQNDNCNSTSSETQTATTGGQTSGSTSSPSQTSSHPTSSSTSSSYNRPTSSSPSSSYDRPTSSSPSSSYNRPTSSSPSPSYNRPTSSSPSSSYNRPTSSSPSSSYNRPTSQSTSSTNQQSSSSQTTSSSSQTSSSASQTSSSSSQTSSSSSQTTSSQQSSGSTSSTSSQSTSSNQQTSSSQQSSSSTSSASNQNNTSTSNTGSTTSNNSSQTSKTDKCESDGFFPSSESCNKFYRCVSNEVGGYTKYNFNCGPGTVWDPENNVCNHPWAVKDEKCRSGGQGTTPMGESTTQSSTSTSSQNNTTPSSSASTTENSNQTSTTSPTESSSQPSTSVTTTEDSSRPTETSENSNTTTTTDSTDVSTTPESNSNATTTEAVPKNSTKPNSGIKCEKAGYYPNPKDCKKFYRCVDWDGDKGERFSVYHFDCPAGTIFDPSLNICNHEESVYPPRDCTGSGSQTTDSTPTTKPDNNTNTESPSTTESSNTTDTTEVPTTPPTTLEPTTDASTNATEPSTTGSSETTPQITTPSESTTKKETETTTIVTSVATTQISTIQPTTTEISTTPSSSETCPELGPDQYALVCPTGFRRHPKFCNLFYQCTVSKTMDTKIVTLSCVNGTIYDEKKIQCLPPEETKKCEGSMMADARNLKKSDDLVTPIVVKSESMCPNEGSFSYKDDCRLFYKCKKDEQGKMTGFLYQCPEGFAFWSVSKRCEKTEKVPCENTKTAPTSWRSTLAPVENKNIGF